MVSTKETLVRYTLNFSGISVNTLIDGELSLTSAATKMS